MSSQSQHLAVTRQWHILKTLPKQGPGMTALEIQRRLEGHGVNVSKRTVERDLQELFLVFNIDRNDKGTPAGWYWADSCGADASAMSLSGAVSLRLIEDILTPRVAPPILEAIRPRFDHANRLIDDCMRRSPTADWTRKVACLSDDFTAPLPRYGHQILQKILGAVFDELQIDILYADSGVSRRECEVRLHPQGLIHRDGVVTLLATAFDDRTVRAYAVNRIARVDVRSEPALVSADFSVRDHLAEAGGDTAGQGGDDIDLDARISAGLAARLRDHPLGAGQKIEPVEGGYRLNVPVQDSPQLLRWILSQGGDIRVTGPDDLAGRVRLLLEETLSAYRGAAAAE